jgi:hypothetical protein
MRLEVLHVRDCPNLPPMLARLAEVTDQPVTTRLIETETEAVTFGMAGSPTLLIDGVDPFATAQDCDCDCGPSCRLYRDPQGRIVAAPSAEQLRDAITAATGSAQVAATAEAGEVLSTWRVRALPQDPVERAVQQAILRAFATTGREPTPDDLEAVLARSGRSSAEILAALHAEDTIRLDAAGHIAVAYPFSTKPTRHRVRIGSEGGDGVDVYAMCAIDALGMSAMIGQDTRIESVDVTTGRPVTVTTLGGRSIWDPMEAVVFIGADAGGGPSADCCCDYLNFFADRESAQAWTSAHPHIPGQILSQSEAEDLSIRLFGHLLRTSPADRARRRA